MYKYKLNSFTLNDTTKIEPKKLTVIVGSNNCGKSRLLKDIKDLTTSNNPKTIVLKDIEISMPECLDNLIQSYNIDVTEQSNNYYIKTLSADFIGESSTPVNVNWKEDLDRLIKKQNESSQKQFNKTFGSFFISLFLTEDRLKLTKESETSDISQSITNILQAYYKERPQIESKFQQIIKEVFNIDIALDYSALRKVLFRIADNFNDLPQDTSEQLVYFKNKETLDEQGDGLRSFVATILALLIGKKPVLLLDEPESFLHPPQAYKLGRIIAEHLDDDRQIILSTHSVDLLKGIISKTHELELLRINRVGNINNVFKLNPEYIASISTNPLLSSTRVLDALFYKSAVIVEADADAIFYKKIMNKIDDANDIHFLHAHNKQTVAKVVKPYINLGVKFSSIVDFDILRVKSEFKKLLEEFNIPNNVVSNILEKRDSFTNLIEDDDYTKMLNLTKTNLINLLDEITSSSDTPENTLTIVNRKLKKIREEGSTWNKYKKGGYIHLDEQAKSLFFEIYDLCKYYGLFIVYVGELESWLIPYELPASSNKSKWIIDALYKIDDIERDEKDIWKFMQEIISYLDS